MIVLFLIFAVLAALLCVMAGAFVFYDVVTDRARGRKGAVRRVDASSGNVQCPEIPLDPTIQRLYDALAEAGGTEMYAGKKEGESRWMFHFPDLGADVGVMVKVTDTGRSVGGIA